MSGRDFINPTHFGGTPSAESLMQPRRELNVHVRIVDNGALLYLSGVAPGISPTQQPPERVAVTIDQAVEQFRELLTKVWPTQK